MTEESGRVNLPPVDAEDTTLTSRTLELEVNRQILELYRLMERWQRYASRLERELELRNGRLADIAVRARSLEDEVAVLRVRMERMTATKGEEGR